MECGLLTFSQLGCIRFVQKSAYYKSTSWQSLPHSSCHTFGENPPCLDTPTSSYCWEAINIYIYITIYIYLYHTLYFHYISTSTKIAWSYSIFLYNPSGCVMMCPSNPVEKSSDGSPCGCWGSVEAGHSLPAGTDSWRRSVRTWRPTDIGG